MPKKTSKPHYKGKHLKIDHHSIFLFKMRSQFHLALFRIYRFYQSKRDLTTNLYIIRSIFSHKD
jgi:hypothetical protein